MIKTIKTISYLIILSFLFTIYSCIQGENVLERTAEMEAAEMQNILTKLIDKGYDIDTTANGVYYVIDEEGTGPTVKTGDTCYVEYVGYLPDGNIFESSGDYYQDGIMEFIFPNENMIAGFNDGLTVMNKGAKIEMIIPSSKAFGSVGTSFVPPYTTVIIVTQLDDLKPAPVE
jgi:FKBP-type peptidyl-prolyl cis-trans isomerase FkpA